MASINIYVPDELKARMGTVEANWSEICRQAIEAELSRQTGGINSMPIEQSNDQTNWVDIPFDEPRSAKDVIVKPNLPPNHSGVVPSEVSLLSSWTAELNKSIGNTSTVGTRVSQLLEGTYSADILIPGEPWRSGCLKLEQRLVFRYPDSTQQHGSKD